MPEPDTTPSEGIDLIDPAPQGRSAISNRLRYSLWAFAIAMGLTIVGGMSLRLINKGAEEKAKQTTRYASEPATSNRATVEKRQSSNETTTPASNPKQPPEPATPAPSSGANTATHPELAHEAEPSQSQPQISPPMTEQERAQLDAERQAYQEAIAARKAPTSYQAYVSLLSAAQPGSPEGASPAGNVPSAVPLPGLPLPPSIRGNEVPSQGSPDDLSALGKRLGLLPTSSSQPGHYKAQNEQGEKSGFLEGTDAPNPADNYLKAARVDPLSEFEVQQGSVIPAAMPLGLNSDTPGQVTAEIRVDVNDALCGIVRKDGSTHCYVLIPHGSKLIGEYNSNVSYGQNRVQVVWTRVLFPDSTSLDLGRMNGHAADGSAGLKDQVDDHWTSKLAGVALTSVLSAGLAVSQNRSNNSVLQYPSTGQVIGASIGQSASQLGQELTQRNFNRQPTLVIRPGQKFLVLVKKDIVFPGPYEPHY